MLKRGFKWELLKTFSASGRDCFSYQDVLEAYPEKDKFYLSKVLSAMVSMGMLIKLRRGIYYIVPTSADAERYLPDWHLVAKCLMSNQKYYIGYYSAMQLHGLITQPAMREIVVTDRQMKATSRIIQGVEFRFVTHSYKRFFGFQSTWVNQYDKVVVSDLEKTLTDALTRPSLSGGMVEIGKAVYETRHKVNLDKLTEYLLRNDSQAAIKRYLFLCFLFDVKRSPSHEILLAKKGHSYPLLDPSGPKEGVKNASFGLKINVDIETIKNAIYT